MKKGFLFVKRSFDIGFCLCASVVLIPCCCIIAVTNCLFLGFPIFFCQQRRGQGDRLFWIWKFRSMPFARSNAMASQDQLSPYGRFLRKYSLDELPSFWNVLKGDLSIVGPRPLLPEFFFPKNRHQMRPGMTGIAQIKGRNTIGWRKKFRYDLWYVSHASFLVDWYVLVKTIPILLSTKGTEIASQKDYFPSKKDDCS